MQRIWSNNDLKPHRLRTFKLSNDPQFEDKFWDVVGLYLNPPEKALVYAAMRRASVRPSNARSSVCRWRPSAPAR